MFACVQRLVSGLYQLFDLCFIEHVLTASSLTSTLACFGHQTVSYGVWLPNIFRFSWAYGLDKREMFGDHLLTKHFTVWTPCLVLIDRV